jgi:hypothetical protein
MMLIVHRCNTVADLLATPVEYGVEIDIRSYGNRLVIHHEPFIEGEDLSIWLNNYRHGTLILNVKEEGLEQCLIDLMAKRGIEDFFFLDQSFPFMIKIARQGERRCAVRVSEYEHVDTAMTLAGKIDWVWVDCFNHFPLSGDDANRLRLAGFRLCLVSPELQQRTGEGEIPALRALLAGRGIVPDAICTKWPARWKA